MQRVAVIDYGMGNLRSVAKAIEHVADGAAEVEVTSDPARIASADRVVFPGQGAVRDCMGEIHRFGLEPVVRQALGTRPFLGICIGLQVLLDASEEHRETPCLGLVPGIVRRFPEHATDPDTGARLSVPHMGWNNVWQRRPHPLFEGVADGERFYFMNSYYADPADAGVVLATTRYAVEFACALAGPGWVAVQFHPEKSARAGLQVLRNFLTWDGIAPAV
ncbi:MAG: imidazole glycerol phosphate synthase subunit HisH [Ectothiorhodospiraceae bacterium]|nr:imidazole glycerol phosphate synthase subunit HisH [Chromatiales bacterium]MCP5157022.1 imidazole glycerol phosphate synthase subunit HisH [Ectothiorhodospiraceae bacterium]